MKFRGKVWDTQQIIQDVTVVVVVVAIMVLINHYSQRHVNYYCRYTVATVTGLVSSSEGDLDAMITYTIMGRKYNSAIPSNKGDWLGSYERGERVFIAYYPGNPNECSLVRNKIVSDSLTEIPTDGWKTLP